MVSFRRYLVASVIAFLACIATSLSAEELPQDSVKVAFPKYFPPQYSLTPEGKPSGFAIEVITEVARRANLKLEFYPTDNWPEAIQLVRNGEADLIPNMGITAEREKYVLFTQPYEQFSIRVFVRGKTEGIHHLDDLNNKRVGTTRFNVANKLVPHIEFIKFLDARSAVTALLNKELDALILPDVVVRKIAGGFGEANSLVAVGDPLKVVHRAVAVSKDKPELFKKIEEAISTYLRSNEFYDTQQSWEETPEESFSIQQLTVFNSCFFIALCALIGGTIYNKLNKAHSIDALGSNIEIRAIGFISVFFLAVLLSLGGTIWVLYDAAFEGQKARLVNIVQSRAKIIESITRFDLQKNLKLGISTVQSHQESIGQVRDAHENFKGFGLTGEVAFAQRIDDEISYILRQRHSDTVKPKNVVWNANEAEPMRRALSGRSGTLVGLDYRGVDVLAAHEPVNVLDAGIVAKIDLAEIRSPYVKAGLIALAISQVILLIGYISFSALAAPILTRLSRSYWRLQTIIDRSPSLIVIRNAKGDVVSSSDEFQMLECERLEEGESSVNHRDGRQHTYLTTSFNLEDPNQISFGSCQISTDISRRVAIETELKQYALAFENTSEGMVISDTNGFIITVNSAFEKISGYTEGEAVGKKMSLVKSGQHDEAFYKKLWSSLKNEGQWTGEIWNRRKNGELYPEWLNINTVLSTKNEPAFFVAVFSDITVLKRAENELHYLAHHDPLTQLPNRLLFKDRLDHALKNAHREQEMVALLALDLDRFKNINDSLGHPAGDELLKSVSAHLVSLVRENDTVSRVGGDEFTIIAEGLTSFHSVSLLADKIVKGMVHDFNLGNQKVMTSISIGIAVYPQDGDTHEELLKNADTALYKAKGLGRNNYQFYTQDLSQSAFEKLVMENQMTHAISNHEFEVYYQPQFDIETDKLVSAEALIRWNHPEYGIVTPDKFIPLAEENGLIVSLGEWVLRTACTQAKKWLDSGYEFERIAVNLSGKQLDRPGLYDTVKSILQSTGLPPQKLELEVTEGFIMGEGRDSISLLESFRDLGITIAIDDFGTGYSSLTYLKRLPIRTLKIDRSFVTDLPHDDEDAAISRAVIALGHSLGMHIIAEGVENHSQLDFLKAEGCEVMQGYLKGKPSPSSEFESSFFAGGIK
jgi:diguanylate cyclase (GGDEF)-like protein/PAS domain S-box-containing protein